MFVFKSCMLKLNVLWSTRFLATLAWTFVGTAKIRKNSHHQLFKLKLKLKLKLRMMLKLKLDITLELKFYIMCGGKIELEDKLNTTLVPIYEDRFD